MNTSRDIEQLDAWNSIRVIPEETTLQEMFDSVAQGQADNVAIEAPDGNFTYLELDQLSSALAMQISKVMDQKIGYIPLMFEKSAASIIAILGILKAGSAYVPLDPGQPEARLKAIRNDIDGDVIVCSASMEAKCALWTRKIVFDLNDFAHSTQTLFPLTRPVPSSTAYIMFTSGSTGKPKGKFDNFLASNREVLMKVQESLSLIEPCVPAFETRSESSNFARDAGFCTSARECHSSCARHCDL
jgi:non-ribosomal peptide synthetase component F